MARSILARVNGISSLLGYTAQCLKKAGLQDKVDEMYEKAKSGDYHNILWLCDEYVQMADEAFGLTNNDEE